MSHQGEMVRQAKAIPKEHRRSVLLSYEETEMHKHLKELFKVMEPDYTIEVTHGACELGKDLVIVKKDNFDMSAIGVVVKCGDIRAKTVGDVDDLKGKVKKIFDSSVEKKLREIESQVQQALSNPAEMKTIFSKLPVSKVFIVLVGELSNQARTRLENEFDTGIEIFDVNWLVDNFTVHYPQVFFEGKVVDFLQRKIQELERTHFPYNIGKNLSEYFVEPLVAKMDDTPIDLDLLIRKRKMPFSHLKSII